MRSWKSTIVGVLLLLGALISGGIATLDDDPSTTIDFEEIIATGAGLHAIIGRDDDKTSEDVGADRKGRRRARRAGSIP